MRSLRLFSSSIASYAAVGLAALAIAAGLSTASFAGVFTNDTVNNMQDNDFENAYRYTGPAAKTDADLQDVNNYTKVSGPLTTGDLLLAIVQFSSVKTSTNAVGNSPLPGQLTAVSLLQIDHAGSNTDPFTFTSASSDTWQALIGKSALQGAVASVYETNSGTPFTANSPNGVLGLNGDVANATTGNLLWTFGFTGTTGTVSGANPFDTGATTVAANSGIGEGWSALAPTNPTTALGTGSFSGALSLFTTGLGAPELNKVDKVGNGFDTPGHPAPGQFGGIRTDIQLSGTLNTGQQGSNFDVASGGKYFINVAPEPSSLLLMGLGFASFAGARLRRRKVSVTA